jgi:hypothetical protein
LPEKLYEALIEEGVMVWFDEKKMKASNYIYETIVRRKWCHDFESWHHYPRLAPKVVQQIRITRTGGWAVAQSS